MHRRAFTASLTAAVLAGPGDAVRASARSRPPVSIAMLMFPGMTALDLVGPQAILAGLAGGRLHLVARQTGPIPSDTGLTMVADTSFETCPGEIDVLFVPGGDATPGQMREEATLAFLRDRAARASWVTSVCTGSLILGAAGLLDGYRATSHWCVRETVLPRLGAIPVNRRVVVDRNRITAAGISAGLDFRSRPGRPSARRRCCEDEPACRRICAGTALLRRHARDCRAGYRRWRRSDSQGSGGWVSRGGSELRAAMRSGARGLRPDVVTVSREGASFCRNSVEWPRFSPWRESCMVAMRWPPDFRAPTMKGIDPWHQASLAISPGRNPSSD